MALAAVAAMTAVFGATGAQAAYTTGTPLSTPTPQYPTGVSVNQSSGDVYVGILGNSFSVEHGAVRRFSRGGTEITCAPNTPTPNYPGSVAVNPANGNLYVLDNDGNKVNTKMRVYEGEGCGAQKTGGEWAVETSTGQPVGNLAADGAGNVYVPNSQIDKLQKFSEAGAETVLVPTLTNPIAAALDSSGNIFVAAGAASCTNPTAGHLKEYDSGGTEIVLPAAIQALGSVTSVAVDKSTGNIFVGRGCGKTKGLTGGFRIEKYDSSFNMLAEFGGAESFAETASTVVFNHLAVDETNGVVYASDPGNHQVQKFVPPSFPLALHTSGPGSGSFECEVAGHTSSCASEYPEGAPVKVIPVAGPGSEFVEFNAENGGECAGASCTVTMSGSRTVNAKFGLASESLSVTEAGSGTGSVACEVNSVPQPCNGSYAYGDTIKVVATPASENLVESIEGTGSASGACSVVGAGESGECSFVLHAPSSVTVVFAPAGFKAQIPATIEGEVPITTSLEGCESPVILGPFVPAEAKYYEGSCAVTATSTGAATELSAADPDETATKGHLVQGGYRLPDALETRATGLAGLEFPSTGGPFAPLSAPSVPLLTYGGPVSADNVTVRFRQHIGLHDALHSGTYAKTITLTLEQTAP